MSMTLLALLLSSAAPQNLNPQLDSLQTVYDRVVAPDGSVAYEALKQDPSLIAKLEAYTQSVAALDLNTLDKPAKLAILINAYNACVLLGVTRAWPIQSVSEIKPDFGFFHEKNWTIASQLHSLDSLEKDLLRPLDPRIHFAVNCASASCPQLDRQVMRPSTVDATLTRLTKRFLADTKRNRFNRAGDFWQLSKIFEWYAADFGGQTGVIRFVRAFAPSAKVPQKISYLEYDWSLNVRARKR